MGLCGVWVCLAWTKCGKVGIWRNSHKLASKAPVASWFPQEMLDSFPYHGICTSLAEWDISWQISHIFCCESRPMGRIEGRTQPQKNQPCQLKTVQSVLTPLPNHSKLLLLATEDIRKSLFFSSCPGWKHLSSWGYKACCLRETLNYNFL